MRAQIHYPAPTFLIIGMCTALLIFSGVASAQGQKKGQQKCINNLNKGAGKMMKAWGGCASSCLKGFAKGDVSDVETCLDTDCKGKKAKAQNALDEKAGSGGCDGANAPDFGFSSAATAGQASIDKELRLVHSIFGNDLNSGVIVTDKPGSKCQQAVWKAIQKCQDTKMKLFGSCKKNELKGKNESATPVTSALELQDACLGVGAGSIPDPKVKLPKCLQRIQKAIDKKCVGLDTAALFPGCEGPVSVACLDAFIECEVCKALNEIDVLSRNCDEFDNGVADGSCGLEPQAAVCQPNAFLPAGEDRIARSTARVSVLIPALDPNNAITLIMAGPTVIQRGEPLPDPNGRRTIDTEIVSMSLSTSSPISITLRESPSLPSAGQIKAKGSGSDFPADSFFDVFFEIEVGGAGGPVLHNDANNPVRLQAKIACLPPYGKLYLPATKIIIPLLDPNGVPVGTITHAQHQVDPILDHFKVYEATGAAGALLDGPFVSLEDQFQQQDVDLGFVEQLLPPVAKNGVKIFRPGDHLLCYDIPTGSFGPAVVELDNQFGPQTIVVGDPERLCVPTEKAIGPLSSLPLNLKIDHLKCYEATGEAPRDPVDPNLPLIVDLEDQFEVEPAIEIGRPIAFCNPVVKTTAAGLSFGINDPAGHLTCYEITPGQFGPLNVNIRNQFHPLGEPLTVGNPLALCVPSAKDSFTPCVPAPADMSAWWPLDEPSGPTAADLAGFNNVGTHQNGPTPVAGVVAGALSFNGTTQYVNAADHAELNFGTGDFSIDAWVRSRGTPGGVVTILDKREDVQGTPRGYHLFLFNGQLGLQMADASFPDDFCTFDAATSACTNYIAIGGPDVADDEWHHVAATVDRDDPNGGGGRLFVDGALVHTFDPTIRVLSLDNPTELRIAFDSPSGFSPDWRGDIDEVQLFKRALLDTEIESIFQAGAAGKCKPTCGNGILEPPEECDDGNVVSGDGCSSDCRNEPLPCGDTFPQCGGSCPPGGLICVESITGVCLCEGCVCQSSGLSCDSCPGPDCVCF